MSVFENYIKDFPGRCKDIYDLAEPTMKQNGLEVSLLLMVASTALIIPYERLKINNSYIQPIHDNLHYEQAANQLSDLLKEPFLASLLWNQQTHGSWCADNLATVQGIPDKWQELKEPKRLLMR